MSVSRTPDAPGTVTVLIETVCFLGVPPAPPPPPPPCWELASWSSRAGYVLFSKSVPICWMRGDLALGLQSCECLLDGLQDCLLGGWSGFVVIATGG